MDEVAGETLAHERLAESEAVARSAVAQATVRLVRRLAAQRALLACKREARIAGRDGEREAVRPVTVRDHAESRHAPLRLETDLHSESRRRQQTSDGLARRLDV